MDYLVYVEYEAETLQFFLWYCDYIKRWMELSPKQKAMAPKWDPENKRPVTSHSRNGSLREKAKMGTILDILDGEEQQRTGGSLQPQKSHRSSPSATNFSLPRSPGPVVIDRAGGDVGQNWEPCKCTCRLTSNILTPPPLWLGAVSSGC